MQRLTREEFFSDVFDYRPGDHLSAISPTGAGKTHLIYQAMDSAMDQNPSMSAVSLMPKPRDPATVQWANQLNLKETPDWPPTRHFWDPKPRGYVLWPHHDSHIDAIQNREQIAGVLRKCLHHQYWKGNSVTFADDVHNLAVLMGLNPELEQFWTAGRSSGAGLWSANQKPSGTLGSGAVSSFSYNAPSHLFLGRDTDERNVKRFAEIGGIEPRQVESIVRNLLIYRIDGNAVSEVLYIDKRGPYFCTLYPW